MGNPSVSSSRGTRAQANLRHTNENLIRDSFIYANIKKRYKHDKRINMSGSICDKHRGKLIGITPHPSDCRNYFLCIDGRTVEMRCAKRYYFDPHDVRCVFPSNMLRKRCQNNKARKKRQGNDFTN